MVSYSQSSDSQSNNKWKDFCAKYLDETLNPALCDIVTGLNQFSAIVGMREVVRNYWLQFIL
jgi:hypothetical protein